MPRVSRVSCPITALGPGRRMVVWFQGCPLACTGCLARDTWSPSGGSDLALPTLERMWREALEHGMDGLTVSGGEPLAQPDELAELLEMAAAVRDELGREADLLVYTGYEPDEVDMAPLRRADAVITGRYDAARPTRLIWRGSANQVLTPRTELGHARYDRHLDHEPERPPMQFSVDGANVWFAGVPARGAMARLERALRARGVTFEGVTWRP
ncbi:anaerobic ribonucleoside-triphosphate reductase activating protein [Actinomadura meyerae]|uniref:Anaerobic ribonucleoside-triphosphate reductase activating protein n=1 Tax=Actinomadura meyerae TaxID=240840 RepID=A0A239NGT2_9ACTN|nr:4Fe-4S single cluster domain-containing protein [Actinomadura meyerae]SNT54091.1 anaerobic ribonucleoside-triphosphate reductase activating protein [Actinomadura meyerae]